MSEPFADEIDDTDWDEACRKADVIGKGHRSRSFCSLKFDRGSNANGATEGCAALRKSAERHTRRNCGS